MMNGLCLFRTIKIASNNKNIQLIVFDEVDILEH